ncbi:hypothetical protein GN958_ATG22652 [Phytophthora infestans]|uniref:Uncharacterized protein n=1 Tax=Phytophthora infestans TaxID=4787 RepID=A0A8S9TH61_PHYIN|nr:hypothetical protein GN958_ATG22652 [Phytophthora infestans]
MVMAAPINHVLLLPEDVHEDGVADAPTVVTVSGGEATVRRLSPRVPSEWLRKAVVGISSGQRVTGQVIEYNGSNVTIRTLNGEFRSSVDDLVEVAPVLCFLTGKNQQPAEDMTMDEVNEQQPKPTDTLQWVNGLSGAESTVSVRHAVDYAYFVDANCRITASVRNKIGERFDDDPRFGNDQVETPVDEGDLEALLQSIGGETTPTQATPNGQRAQIQSRVTENDTQDNHPKILAAIANELELIRFYLILSHRGASKRSAPIDDSRESQRRRIQSASDLIDTWDQSDRRPKNALAPTRTQQLISGLIAAPDYASKDPSVVVDKNSRPDPRSSSRIPL